MGRRLKKEEVQREKDEKKKAAQETAETERHRKEEEKRSLEALKAQLKTGPHTEEQCRKIRDTLQLPSVARLRNRSKERVVEEVSKVCTGKRCTSLNSSYGLGSKKTSGVQKLTDEDKLNLAALPVYTILL